MLPLALFLYRQNVRSAGTPLIPARGILAEVRLLCQ